VVARIVAETVIGGFAIKEEPNPYLSMVASLGVGGGMVILW